METVLQVRISLFMVLCGTFISVICLQEMELKIYSNPIPDSEEEKKTYLLLSLAVYFTLTMSQKEFIINQRPLLNESLHVFFFVNFSSFFCSYHFCNEKSPHLICNIGTIHSFIIYMYTISFYAFANLFSLWKLSLKI